MIYGYIRVSTDGQNVENQRYEIEKFCKGRNIIIKKWISEIVSGMIKFEDRKLGKQLQKCKKGDILIATELSRLGRNLLQVMSLLNLCMEREICVMTTKEHYELGNNISSKILAFAFSLSAEIERQLISQRTKEALARKKSEGVILGRPKGKKSCKTILTGKEFAIKKMIAEGMSKAAISRKLKVHRHTLDKKISDMTIP